MGKEWWSDLIIEDDRPKRKDSLQFQPFDASPGDLDRRPSFATILMISSLGFGVSFSLFSRVGGSFESLHLHLCNSFCVNIGIIALSISQYQKGRERLTLMGILLVSLPVAFLVTMVFFMVWALIQTP